MPLFPDDQLPNADLWTAEPSYDPAFIAASERFGGTVDLSMRPDDRWNESPEGSQLTRALYLRPLNIIHRVADNIASRSEATAKALSRVRFGYIFSPIPNAYCWQAGGLTHLGVTSGLAHFLHNWAAHLLSLPTFLETAIDGSEQETASSLEDFRLAFDMSHLLLVEHDKALLYRRSRLPRSRRRSVASYEIVHFAIMFAFLHELGHYLGEHARFAPSFLESDNSFSELAFADDCGEDGTRLHQFFELLADTFAYHVFLDQRIAEIYSLGSTDSYLMWSMSLDLLYMLFGATRSTLTPASTHPHPQARIASKLLFLDQYNRQNPGRVTATLNSDTRQTASVQEVSGLGTLGLVRAWESLRLSGYEDLPFSTDAATERSFAEALSIWSHKSPLREAYVKAANWNLIIACANASFPFDPGGVKQTGGDEPRVCETDETAWPFHNKLGLRVFCAVQLVEIAVWALLISESE